MKIGGILQIATCVLVALALTLVAGLVSGASAARGTAASGPSLLSFTDPAGDASGAPDITNVAINGDAGTGTITISVTATGFKPASPDGMTRIVDLWMDTDNNRSTGSTAGNEYLLETYDDPADPEHWWGFAHWTGSAWQSGPYGPTVRFGRGGDVLRWTINKADLGGATGFALYATAVTVDASDNVIARDVAPEVGAWVYDISGPTRTQTIFLTSTIGKPVMIPAQAIAGKRFTVSFPVSQTGGAKTEPLTRGTMVGAPSVAGKVIRHTESFTAGVARLSFVVPKTAKGKQLKVKVTIKASSYQGEGTWVDIATGRFGVLGISYSGQTTTKVVSVRIR